MMQAMSAGGPGGMGGPPPGFGPPPGMRITRRMPMPMMMDDDDDDEDGIPPEILDLIRMTSMMQSRSMGGSM
jgi:hypothetical protein